MRKNRVCIIGCGNTLMGNDGAGIQVMHCFEGKFSGVDTIDGGTGGFGLIPLMEGYEKVVIVDAMVGIGDRIGDVLTFEAPPSWDLPAYALHDMGIGEVVAIARELGYAGEIVTVGIEVGNIQAFSREIDPAVKEGILIAGQEIRKILQEWGEVPGDIS